MFVVGQGLSFVFETIILKIKLSSGYAVSPDAAPYEEIRCNIISFSQFVPIAKRMEIIQHRVEQDNQLLIVIDASISVDELHIERSSALQCRSNPCHGLPPMNPVVPGRIEYGDIGEQPAVFFPEPQQRQDNVKICLGRLPSSGYDILNLGIRDYSAIRMTSLITRYGLIQPYREVKYHIVKPVLHQRIVLPFRIDNVLRPILSKGDFSISGIPFPFK